MVGPTTLLEWMNDRIHITCGGTQSHKERRGAEDKSRVGARAAAFLGIHAVMTVMIMHWHAYAQLVWTPILREGVAHIIN